VRSVGMEINEDQLGRLAQPLHFRQRGVEIGWRLAGGKVAEINFDFRAGSGQSQNEPETGEKFLHSTQRNKKCLDDKESVGTAIGQLMKKVVVGTETKSRAKP